MKRVGLRPYFLFSLVLAAVVVGLISGELWMASDQWARTAVRLKDAVESISAAQTVSDRLDIHRRQALLKGLHDFKTRETLREAAERELHRSMREIADLQNENLNREYAQRAEAAVEAYLAQCKLFTTQGISGDILYLRSAPFFDAAKDAISLLISGNEAQAEVLEQAAIHQGASYKSWSIGLFVFVLSAIFLSLWLFQHFVYIPIMRLRDSIENFSMLNTAPPAVTSGLSEVHEISQAFRTLVATLHRQNEQRLIFLSAVAHDLRNPLSAIQMSMDLLLERKTSTTNLHALTEIVNRQVLQLRRLVDDLLDATRIESGHLELQIKSADLGILLRDSVELFRSLSEKHRLHLNIPTDPIALECDSQRLCQVFNNLLSNAIKYSPQGGEVRVALQRAADFAVISFADQGIGIEPDDFDAIFEPFRRPSASTHQIPGVGLGLSTSRKIVEAHQGWIRVQSRVGHGTVFLISLPLIKSVAQLKTLRA
jgi:two-component system sensor histidine kinase MtrB